MHFFYFEFSEAKIYVTNRLEIVCCKLFQVANDSFESNFSLNQLICLNDSFMNRTDLVLEI